MKYVLILLQLIYCFVLLVGCISTRAGRESRFHRVEFTEEEFRFNKRTIWNTYALTESEVIGFGTDASYDDGNDMGTVLYLYDKSSQRALFSSEPFDWPEDYWLHICRTRSHTLILWEIQTEYYAVLYLYVFEPQRKQFSYAGEFCVVEFDTAYSEYSIYSVDDISIEPSDTLVAFKFTKKLKFGEFYPFRRVADSIAYELDLRDKTLRLTKIWNEQAYRSKYE